MSRTPATPASEAALQKTLVKGEGAHAEWQRTTGELREGTQTLYAFSGFDRFEPPVAVPVARRRLANKREVIALRVEANTDSIPFAQGWLQREFSDRPQSPRQRHLLTEAGRAVLQHHRGRA